MIALLIGGIILLMVATALFTLWVVTESEDREFDR